MPGTDVPDPRDRDDELDARELERGEAAAELERIRREELEAEARAKAERLDELEAEGRADAEAPPARETVRGEAADPLALAVQRVVEGASHLARDMTTWAREEGATRHPLETELLVRNLAAVPRPELEALAAAMDEERPPVEEPELGDSVRRRMRDVVHKIATVRLTPADFRDVSIGLAALGSSLEDVEAAAGRRWLHERRLRKIAEDLQALLELVGEPDGHGEGVERAYWPVREDLDELRELAGADRATLSAGPGGGLLARLARVEAQRDAAHEEAAYRKRAEETLRDELNRERRLLALKLGDFAHRLTGYRTADQPDRVIVNVAEDLDKLADDLGPAEETRG